MLHPCFLHSFLLCSACRFGVICQQEGSSADCTALRLLQNGCLWCIEQDALMQNAISGSTAVTPVASPSGGGSVSSRFHRQSHSASQSASQSGSPFPTPAGVKSSRCCFALIHHRLPGFPVTSARATRKGCYLWKPLLPTLPFLCSNRETH